MKILLLGANGQVGWELQRALSPLGQVKICTRQEADLENLDALRSLVQSESPQIIVNAAAYTAVDKAESDVDRARCINARAVGVLAEEAARLGAWLLHYSTDYVFDGKKAEGAYTEYDPIDPASVYGMTKWEGEQAIRASGCLHFILRTSWVFATRGGNFAKTMLRLAGERSELKVVADQWGAPTSAELIADVTAHLIQRIKLDAQWTAQQSGTYHLTAAGHTNWHAYAQLVLGEALAAGWNGAATVDNVLPIPTTAYPLPAPRPANSRLDTSKLCTTFGLNLPPWQFHVKRMVAELIKP